MVKCLEYEQLKERVEALEKENRQLRKGPARAEVLMDGNQTEEELARSEEKYRIVADFTYDWEMWMSPSGHYLYVSPSCERITGYLAEEFMADPSLFWRILHPEDLALVEKHHRDEAEGSGQTHSIDFRIIHCRGEERWLSHSCQPVYGHDGCFLGRRVSNRDVTERKQAEKALRESNANARALIDNPVDSVLLVDPDGIIIETNQTFAQRMGRRVDELIGKCVYDLLPPELAKSRRASVDEIVRFGAPVRFEDERAGMWLDQSAHPVFDAQGRVVRIAVIARDITERKRVEEALRRKNLEIRTITDGVPGLVAYVDRDGIYRFANRQYEEWFGLAPTEVIGKHFTEVLGRDAGERLRCYVKKAFSGERVSFEETLPYKHGSRRWVNVEYLPDTDDNGTVKGFFGLVTDITERKRLEDELKQSEARFRAIFENSMDGIFVTAPDGRVFSANPAACKMTGYTESEIIEMGRGSVIDPTDPRLPDALEERRSTGRFRGEMNWMRKGGSKFPVEFSSTIFKDEQGREMTTIIARDITDRKRTETILQETQAFLMSILDNTPALIHVNTPDYRYSLVNRSWKRFTGKTAQEVLGRNPTELFSAKTASKFHATHRRVINTRAPVALEEVVWRGHKKFHFHTTLFPLIDASGEIRSVGGISVDITELKRAEEQLLETREQLFQSQKMETLGTLVAGVAHEINNPISLVLFNAPLLRRIWSDLQPVIERHADVEHQRKYAGLSYEYLKNNLDRLLADMDQAGNRIAAIVNHLKEFARKSDISEKNLMSLNEAVKNALGFSKMSFRKAGVRLKVALGTDLPSMIGNMQRIEQIILNVLVNAVQAIKHKQGLIEIKTSYDEPRGGVTLSVSDNGEGIDPSTSGRIFDPFYTTRQGEGGTGLGLSVTYNLVKEHHGRITFESEVGKGTTFKVFFPLRAEKKRFKVLAVDDENSFLEILKNAFGKLSSFDFEIAPSGMDALIKIGTFHPDILIMDLMMPGMDGLELCCKLRESPELAQTKVVVVTGFWEDPKLDTIRELGFMRIYRKPLDLEAFVKEIEKMV